MCIYNVEVLIKSRWSDVSEWITVDIIDLDSWEITVSQYDYGWSRLLYEVEDIRF